MTAESPHSVNHPGNGNSAHPIDEHMRFIRTTARQLGPLGRRNGYDVDDLVQIASERALKRLSAYDPTQGTMTTFLGPIIRGSIIDEIRDNGPGVKIPRRIQRLNKRLGQATEKLTQKLGRQPTQKELAAELDIPYESLVEVFEAKVVGMPYSLTSESNEISDHNTWSQKHVSEGQIAAPTNSAEDGYERRKAVHDAISQLPERLQLVIRRYYYDEIPLGRIGVDLGVTESRVCQLLAQAEGRLQKILEAKGFNS